VRGNLKNKLSVLLCVLSAFLLGACTSGSIDLAAEDNIQGDAGFDAGVESDNVIIDYFDWEQAGLEMNELSTPEGDPYLEDHYQDCTPEWRPVGECDCSPSACEDCSGARPWEDGCGHQEDRDCTKQKIGCPGLCCGKDWHSAVN